MADVRDIRDSTVAMLRKSGLSGERAEAAGRRLEQHLTRRENGQPVNPRPSIVNETRRS